MGRGEQGMEYLKKVPLIGENGEVIYLMCDIRRWEAISSNSKAFLRRSRKRSICG